MPDEPITPPPTTTTPPDWWYRWFWRAVNVVGVVLVVREAFLSRDMGAGPSWPILLVGLALILGAAGVQLFLKGGQQQ